MASFQVATRTFVFTPRLECLQTIANWFVLGLYVVVAARDHQTLVKHFAVTRVGQHVSVLDRNHSVLVTVYDHYWTTDALYFLDVGTEDRIHCAHHASTQVRNVVQYTNARCKPRHQEDTTHGVAGNR